MRKELLAVGFNKNMACPRYLTRPMCHAVRC